MSKQLAALRAELFKIKHASIVGVTFIAFALAPLMGGVFMIIVQDPEALTKASGLNTKMQAMSFAADWPSYFGILTQAIGVGGILVFGFIVAWIFGREYSDGTAKDLLSLPVSRVMIINAKLVVVLGWCFALSVSNLLIGYIIGTSLHLAPVDSSMILSFLINYFTTALLTVPLSTPIAFLALWGKGYLAPLGFVALTLVFAQIIAAMGYGYFFPWAVPGLFSGSAGAYKEQLNWLSYTLLLLTGVVGYLTSVCYWKYADQTK